MKPISLRMCAFGAFAYDTGVISFEPFEKSGIFLITGETGAGKTTIFDAICFALYGTASGDVRNPKQFRSQYTTYNIQTYVNFKFSCGDKTYMIHRVPNYMRVSRRNSNVLVEQKTEAQLFLIDDDSKKILLKDSPREVDDAVTEITGLDGKQFRQIVMIAQGEFRKFLLSSSKDKETILRQLFHTQNCEKIGQLVKERLDKQKNLVQEYETTILTLLNQVQPSEAEQKQEYQKILKESGVGATENLCEMLSDASERTKDSLTVRKAELKEQEAQLEELVKEIEKGKQHNENFEQLSKNTERLKKESEALEKCRASADDAEKNAERLPELQQKITVLEHSLPAYTQAAQLQSEENELKKKHDEQKKSCDKAKAAYEQTNESCLKLSEELKDNTDLAIRITRLGHDIQEEKRKQEALKLLKKYLEQLCSARSDYELQLKKTDSAQNSYFTVDKPEYDRIEKQFFRSMAGNLAQQLQENKPCPVCGSCTHPKPAKWTEETVTEEQFQKAKTKQQNALQQLEAQRKLLVQQEERCNSSKQQCIRQAKQCGLPDDADMAVVQEHLEQSVSAAAKNQELLDAAQKQYKQQQQKQQLLAMQKEKLPQLQLNYENSRAESERLQVEFAAKEAERKQCQSNLTYASLTQAKAQLKQMRDEAEDLEKRQRQTAEELHNQKEKTASQQKIVQHFQEIVGDTPKYDTESAELKLSRMRNKKSVLEHTIQQSQEECRTLAKIAKEARVNNKKLSAEAKRKVQIEQLHKMLNGTQKGRERISFERYVQTYYFNRVLAFANQKLYQLSGGRYRFERRQEETRFNISGGLNLDILDQYTGKARAVETLSGGETFLASLALALGLSDTVQQESGGIKMNAMFIDEGFGSLDSTALDNAVRVLQQLSDHQRLIGIISHVAELSERFDAQICVEKTIKGSHIECHYE